MNENTIFMGILGLLASSLVFAADEKPKWMTEGPRTESRSIAFEVPVEIFANQVVVEVEVGGAPRRFLFDTGSPSMMNTALAEELGLEVVHQTQGRDSHGAIIETDVVQADLAVGGTTFRKVPVFVAEFPEIAQCRFDGVLGSELLPMCAWQIDAPDGMLRCNTNTDSLDHVSNASKQALHDFGYPHAPFLDIQLAPNATSKAMLDTGSPEYMAISPPDFEGARRNAGVSKLMRGSGSIGGSIGGRAPEKDQLQIELNSLAIGTTKNNVELHPTVATLRESPPSLIGAALLQNFIVTLDSRNAAAYFEQYGDGPFARASYGFGLDFDETVSVSLVWEDSPAAVAGLRVGQTVKSLNGEPVTNSCEGMENAMRAMHAGDTLAIEWEGGAATLKREITLTD